MPYIPTPIRAALGLAATAVAEARKLPETLPQLPVAAVSTAMQASLRVQQHIATFAARGDEVITQLRGTTAEPPSWATFDESPAGTVAGHAKAAFDRAEPANLEDTADLAEPDRFTTDQSESEHSGSGQAEPGHAEPAHVVPADTAAVSPGQPAIRIDPDGASSAGSAAASATKASKAVKAAPTKAATKAATKAPAKKVPPAKATAGKAPAKAAAKKAPAKKAIKKSEPLAEAAKKADPSAGPNPSTMAAEILHAHQGESPATP